MMFVFLEYMKEPFCQYFSVIHFTMQSHTNQTHTQVQRGNRRPQVIRPLLQDVVDHGHRYTIVQRVQSLKLTVEGFSYRDIEARTGVKKSTQIRIKQRAFERGFQPKVDRRILEHYVADAPKSGRPKQIGLDIEQKLLQSVRADKAGREKSSEVLAFECGISRSSALPILKKYGLTRVKPTRKPGLNPVQRAARLAFCLDHKDWTLEDWQRVI